MNNRFIQAQIQNIITMVETFKEACRIAALEDDGKISKEEAKTLKRINAATERYIKELRKIG